MTGNNGLLASAYSDWINADISIDSNTKQYIEFFVMGTPSLGLSWKGRELYSFYFYENPEEYVALWDKLCEGIEDYLCAKTYDELWEKLKKHEWLCFSDMPTDVAEAIYIYVGDYKNDKLHKEYFSESKVDSKGKENKKRSEEAKEYTRIACVNKLFYHVRNSFAHGCYALFEDEMERYYIFQDVKPGEREKTISARIVVSEARIKKWIKILENNRAVRMECRKNKEVSPCPA